MWQISRWTTGLLGAALVASCAKDARETAPEAPALHVSEAPVARAAHVAEEARAQIERAGSAAVIVALEEPGGEGDARRAAIAERQEGALRGVASGLRLHHRFQHAPMFSATLTAEGLRALRMQPFVRSIGLDPRGRGALAVTVPALGALAVHHNQGYTGKGITIAVLDSGVDVNHPDLAGKVVAQHCFTHGACPPGATDEGTEAPDGEGHGTSVAAVAASMGAIGPTGFAPDAKLVSVRVLDDHASGYLSDWIAGLEWVRANLAAQPVQIVNMSVGTTQLFEGACDSDPQSPAFALMASTAAQVVAAGVTVFASSGNQGSQTSLSSPSCTTNVIAVGATYGRDVGPQPWQGSFADHFGSSFSGCSDAQTGLDVITCFTNSGPRLDIVAPGGLVFTSYPGNNIGYWFGTSQASPTAAGTAALMLQANPSLTPARIAALLASTGHPLVDAKNGSTYPRIDALAAVRAALCDGMADGTPCDDGETCTSGDVCHNGLCEGAAVADGAPCDDGNACTSGDACKSAVCAGQDTNACATPDCAFPSECKPETAACVTMTVKFFDGESCDAGACMTAGACALGLCLGGTPAPDGTPCAEGACTQGECMAPLPDAGVGGNGGSSASSSSSSGGPESESGGGCGCATPRSAPSSYAWVALLIGLACRFRRRNPG
jgi:MYXO-CTERM domain-containing protein